MSEVKVYDEVVWYGQVIDMVSKSDFDAQRLRADTAEAELEVLRQQHAEQSCIFCNNSGELLSKVKAAEQRIARMTKVLTDIRQSCELSHLRDAQIDAALNPNPEAVCRDHNYHLGECTKCGAISATE